MKFPKLKSLINEIARDSLALGSIPFFIIVAARSAIGTHYNFLFQILTAGLILFILSLFLNQQNHIARATILFIFTTWFYNDLIYTIFAFFLIILLFISLLYLKYSKKQIISGTIAGIISSATCYFIFFLF